MGERKSNNPTLASNRVYLGFSLLKEKLTDHNKEIRTGSNIQVVAWEEKRPSGQDLSFLVPKSYASLSPASQRPLARGGSPSKVPCLLVLFSLSKYLLKTQSAMYSL